MSLFHSIILGIVQGLTEFLPISSSAHLALLEQIFGIHNKLQITVFLHLGSVIAIIVAMRKELKTIITQQTEVMRQIIIGSIPAGITGLLFASKVGLTFESPKFIAISLIITGIILWLTRSIGVYPLQKPITPISAFIIGISQSIAILPGISRSGITIATSIYLGIDRTEAAKFSFLLAIISILGANIYETISNYSEFSIHLPLSAIIGVIFSFVASRFAIKCVLKVVKTKNFALFSLYCWILGFIVLTIV